MREKAQPNFDEDFQSEITAWRRRYQLREDDAILLLLELFRIHQRHWDEIRHSEIPSLDQFRTDMSKLAEASRVFQQESAALRATIGNQPFRFYPSRITRTAALLAATACLFAGYLIGRFW